MRKVRQRMRQIVDWRAAFIAGAAAGIVFLLLTLFVLPQFVHAGNVWVTVRLLASVVLGESILAPPATFDGAALIFGVGTHFIFSFLFALVIAFVIHRWGLWVGIFGGGFLGLCLYLFNIYTLTLFAPGFFALKGSAFAVVHVIFGAVAGGVYELLEVEKFVPMEEADF